MNKGFIIVKIVLWSIVAFLCAFIFIGSLENFINSDRYTTESNIYIDANEHIVRESVSSIDIDWISGNISVLPHSEEYILVQQYVPDSFNGNENMEVSVRDTTLHIDQEDYDNLIHFMHEYRSDLMVFLPQKQYDELKVDSVGSRIVIKGDFSEVKIDSVSSSAEIYLNTMPRRFQYDSVAGSTHLYIPENSGFTLRFDKIVGNLHSDFSLSTRGESTYVYGDGNAQFSADTISGKFSIMKNDNTGDTNE